MPQKSKTDTGRITLLPLALIAAVVSAALCLSAGYSGWGLVGRFVLFFVVCFLAELVTLLLVVAVMSLFVDLQKPQKTHSPFYTGMTKYVMGMMTALLRVRIHMEGEEKIPEGRWLLVSNHVAAFDPLLCFWALRKYDLAFVSKPENIYHLPIFGKYAHKCCCLALNREDDREALRTILAAAELIKNDVTNFCIYPEGTRNHGKGLLPFRNGAFKIAQKAKCPIVVMVVEHTEDILKNFPFRHTDVVLRIAEVIGAEQVSAMKTPEIGEEVRRCMLCESV